MIYIEFCIQKSILKLFGDVFFLGGRPSKIPTFSESDPEHLERGPQYSARRRNFQEKPTCVCSSAIGLQSHHVWSRLIPPLAVPHPKKTKKCHFCPFRYRFQSNGLSTAEFNMRCHETNLSSSPDTELKTYVLIFEKNTFGMRYSGAYACLSIHNQKNRSIFRGRI